MAEDTYQELGIVVPEDLRCLGSHCLTVGSMTSEATPFEVY